MLYHLPLNKMTQVFWTSLVCLQERKLFAIREIQSNHSKGTPEMSSTQKKSEQKT